MKIVNVDLFNSFHYKGFYNCSSEVKLCIIDNNIFYINVKGTSPANMFNDFVDFVRQNLDREIDMNNLAWYHIEPKPPVSCLAYKYNVIWENNQYITPNSDSPRFYRSEVPSDILTDIDMIK